MSSNNSPTGNNAPRPDNPNVAAPPPVPALPGPAADDADDGLIVANPIDTFGRPFLATVPFDKLHLYDAADLTASRMYQPGPCKANCAGLHGLCCPQFPTCVHT